MWFRAGCLVLVLIGASTVSAQKIPSDLAVLDVEGRVREVVESTSFRGSTDGTMSTDEKVYRFDSNGKLTEFAVYWNKGMEGRFVYTYDPDGSRNEKLSYSNGEVLTFRREVNADGQGRYLQVADYCGNGILMYTEKYKYKPGDVVEVSKYIEDGRLPEVRRLRYENGRLSEMTGPNDYSEVRTYFDSGRVKDVKVYFKHQLATETTYTYKFDKYGNWIERKTLRRGLEAGRQVEKESLDYRTITYFPTDGRDADKGETTGQRADPATTSKPGESGPAIIRRSGGVLQGMAVRRLQPAYPSTARSNRITGDVVVEITIDQCGRVTSTQVLSGPAELRDASVQAARLWVFLPTRLNKIPAKVIGTLTFHYRM
jgi:TonB family protein